MFLFYLVMLNTDESSSGEKEDNSKCTRHPPFKVCREESFISYEEKKNERVYLEESDGPTLSVRSSSSTEGQQRKMLIDSDEKPFRHGNVTVHQRNKTAYAKTSSHKRNMKSHHKSRVADELVVRDRTPNIQQSTSSQAEQRETKRSAPCQTVRKKIIIPDFGLKRIVSLVVLYNMIFLT